MELSPELVIADRFRLVRPLGHGGMGSVWLAHHIRLQIPCAVKFMLPEVAAEPAFRARFDREAVAAAQLRSPHVVQILDHGTWEGSPYIAMEYLEGEGLETRLHRQKTLSPAETAAIVAQIARALTKAHAVGLVHRDLKPPNVFLVRDDDREIAKVLDFGVAKSSGPSAGGHTKTGAIMGTPYYMSPEQAQGTKAVDHRTDLWALGVLAYECLTGTLPFVSDAFGDLVLKIIVEPIPVPSQVAPVPPGFDAWWARAVDRDPAARFQSARELSDALSVALGLGAAEGIGSPSLVVSGAPPAGETGGASAVSTPAGAAIKPALVTSAAVAASVGAPPQARSRAVALGGVALLALLGAGALVAFGGRTGPAPAAVVPAAPVVITAPAALAATVAETVAPIASAPAIAPAPASASPSASASASPSVSAATSASASAPKPADSATTKAGPRAAGKGVAPGHDLGF